MFIHRFLNGESGLARGSVTRSVSPKGLSFVSFLWQDKKDTPRRDHSIDDFFILFYLQGNALRGVTFCADRKSPKSCPGEMLCVVLPHAKAALPWEPHSARTWGRWHRILVQQKEPLPLRELSPDRVTERVWNRTDDKAGSRVRTAPSLARRERCPVFHRAERGKPYCRLHTGSRCTRRIKPPSSGGGAQGTPWAEGAGRNV